MPPKAASGDDKRLHYVLTALSKSGPLSVDYGDLAVAANVGTQNPASNAQRQLKRYIEADGKFKLRSDGQVVVAGKEDSAPTTPKSTKKARTTVKGRTAGSATKRRRLDEDEGDAEDNADENAQKGQSEEEV